jgi:hypothetical protein
MVEGQRLKPSDALIIFLVGGGNLEKNVSPSLIRALQTPARSLFWANCLCPHHRMLVRQPFDAICNLYEALQEKLS